MVKVIRDRKISVCSKLSLESLIKEKERLDRANKGVGVGCDIAAVIGYNLAELNLAVGLLKCYILASIDKRDINLSTFIKQIVSIQAQINAIHRLYRLNQYSNNQDEIYNQFLDIQYKLDDLNNNDLVVQLSHADISLQTYNSVLFSVMNNIISLLQLSLDSDIHDGSEFDKVYCQTNDLMINEFRQLGTNFVDRLIMTAKTVVSSLDNFATKSSNLINKVNTFKDMYDQISSTAKILQDGLKQSTVGEPFVRSDTTDDSDNYATKSVDVLSKLTNYKKMYDQISLTAKVIQGGLTKVNGVNGQDESSSSELPLDARKKFAQRPVARNDRYNRQPDSLLNKQLPDKMLTRHNHLAR